MTSFSHLGETGQSRMVDVGTKPVQKRTATAGARGRTLPINLPGNPRAIAECLVPTVPAIQEQSSRDMLCGGKRSLGKMTNAAHPPTWHFQNSENASHPPNWNRQKAGIF
jgi:hypothetical protein